MRPSYRPRLEELESRLTPSGNHAVDTPPPIVLAPPVPLPSGHTAALVDPDGSGARIAVDILAADGSLIREVSLTNVTPTLASYGIVGSFGNPLAADPLELSAWFQDGSQVQRMVSRTEFADAVGPVVAYDLASGIPEAPPQPPSPAKPQTLPAAPQVAVAPVTAQPAVQQAAGTPGVGVQVQVQVMPTLDMDAGLALASVLASGRA